MKKVLICRILIVAALIFTTVTVSAQNAARQAAAAQAMLIKGGHVIDPKNNIDGVMDVLIKDGKIAQVARNITAPAGAKVINAQGLHVTPGLIDIHMHAFYGSDPGKFANGTSSVKPDDFAPRSGVTTVVDAGCSGWRNFAAFKKQVIDLSKTRVLAFLNTFGSGMIGAGLEEDVNDIDPAKIAETIKANPNIIVGIKFGHYRGSDWAVVEKGLAAARAANLPLLMECNLPNLSFEGKLSRMAAGDIYTHAFNRETIDSATNKIKPFVQEARKKGILFDVGHGGSGFRFSQGIPAADQGFFPNSFGTDMHYNSVNAGMKDMLNIMSKYLNMGMKLNDVIRTATWASASIIKQPELGHLSVGAPADIAILRLQEGNFGFVDAGGFRIDGKRKFETEMTIRAGVPVWDLNGRAAQKAL